VLTIARTAPTEGTPNARDQPDPEAIGLVFPKIKAKRRSLVAWISHMNSLCFRRHSLGMIIIESCGMIDEDVRLASQLMRTVVHD
jgi:hypothetical protein